MLVGTAGAGAVVLGAGAASVVSGAGAAPVVPAVGPGAVSAVAVDAVLGGAAESDVAGTGEVVVAGSSDPPHATVIIAVARTRANVRLVTGSPSKFRIPVLSDLLIYRICGGIANPSLRDQWQAREMMVAWRATTAAVRLLFSDVISSLSAYIPEELENSEGSEELPVHISEVSVLAIGEV